LQESTFTTLFNWTVVIFVDDRRRRIWLALAATPPEAAVLDFCHDLEDRLWFGQLAQNYFFLVVARETNLIFLLRLSLVTTSSRPHNRS
jgi:hypothetical protein